jgi:hypothetical protein
MGSHEGAFSAEPAARDHPEMGGLGSGEIRGGGGGGLVLVMGHRLADPPGHRSCHRREARRPVFQRLFWDLGPGHKPDISLEKYKAVIKLLVAATAGCQGAKN